MSSFHFIRSADGGIRLEGVPTIVCFLLLGVPELLDPEPSGAVRDRLCPSPTEDDDDDEAREDWERLMVPELFALVASAREIIERDLELLDETMDEDEGGRLMIPPAHVDAWISALNVARLTLGAEHALEASDLEGRLEEQEDVERADAVIRVSLLGEIQGLLIECKTAPPGL